MTYKAFVTLNAPTVDATPISTTFAVAWTGVVFNESTGESLPNVPSSGNAQSSGVVSGFTVNDDSESIADAVQNNIGTVFGVTIRKMVIVTGR